MTEIHAFDPDGTPSPGAEAGVSAITSATMEPQVASWVRDMETETGRRVTGLGLVITADEAPTATTLQSRITAAASMGVPATLVGDFSLDAAVYVPAGATVDGSRATLRMTKARTSMLILSSVDDVVLSGISAIGLGTDWQDDPAVYAAAAIYVAGTSSRVVIRDCTLRGFAGAGVRTTQTAGRVSVEGCVIEGPGSDVIPYMGQYGAAISIGSKSFAIRNCDISGTPQGIVTGGVIEDVSIVGNVIHDIPGQHGLYLTEVARGTVADNIIRDTALLGMKVQIGTADSPGASDIAITGNVVSNVGDHGILLTNPTGGSATISRAVIANNVLSGVLNDGISVSSSVSVSVIGNSVTGARAGIAVASSRSVMVSNNQIRSTGRQGISVDSTNSFEVLSNRIEDPAGAADATSNFGIHVRGASSAGGSIIGNIVTDSQSKMRWGIALGEGVNLSDFVIARNAGHGATDYGIRAYANPVIREMQGNTISGQLGGTLAPPLSGAGARAQHRFGSGPPAEGTHARGDLVWSTAPAPGGHIGWVCTTAGSPGVWKLFGGIVA